jgi:hypothetical protein
MKMTTRTFLALMGAGLVALLGACSSNPVPSDGPGGNDVPTGADAPVSDATGGVDAMDLLSEPPADATAQNPCAPGTCRFQSDPSGECLPPGGPTGQVDGPPMLSGCCGCGSDGFCNEECVCASPDTPIATPAGDRPISRLSVGDLVYSIHRGQRVAVPLLEIRRRPVRNHRVIEVVLEGGERLQISAAHPTADGRSFGQLIAGDWLGGRLVVGVGVVAYRHEATFDIRPDSDTGTYFAAGALIGTTLPAPPIPAMASLPGAEAPACTLPLVSP